MLISNLKNDCFGTQLFLLLFIVSAKLLLKIREYHNTYHLNKITRTILLDGSIPIDTVSLWVMVVSTWGLFNQPSKFTTLFRRTEQTLPKFRTELSSNIKCCGNYKYLWTVTRLHTNNVGKDVWWSWFCSTTLW